MSWLRRRPPAGIPRNVRVVFDTGRAVPVECVYTGWDRRRRLHRWVAVAPVGLCIDRVEGAFCIQCDEVPPQTEIELVMAIDFDLEALRRQLG